jgi:hypothetical protein
LSFATETFVIPTEVEGPACPLNLPVEQQPTEAGETQILRCAQDDKPPEIGEIRPLAKSAKDGAPILWRVEKNGWLCHCPTHAR